jgi:hypothetical protein
MRRESKADYPKNPYRYTMLTSAGAAAFNAWLIINESGVDSGYLPAGCSR